MSDLEGHAKPIVGPLLNDVSFSLDSSQQAVLARWSVKTAMVFEATDRSRDWFYSDADRQGVSGSVLPARTWVWIGRYVQSNILCSEARKLHEHTPRSKNPFVGGHAITLVIRRLVIQVLTVRLKPEFAAAGQVALNVKRGPWESLLSQIWPTETARVKWPPGMSFDDSGISFPELSGRFRTGERT